MMSNFAFSQNSYPQQIVYKGDIAVVITMEQVKILNQAHLAIYEYKELNDSLLVVIDIARKGAHLYDSVIADLRDGMRLKDQAIADRDIVISKQKGIIITNKKEIKKLKVHKTLIGITSVVAITAIILLLIL